MLRCLPPLANSFFIFNANEDNRLCIDPVFKTPDQATYDIENAKRYSLIPVCVISVFLLFEQANLFIVVNLVLEFNRY